MWCGLTDQIVVRCSKVAVELPSGNLSVFIVSILRGCVIRCNKDVLRKVCYDWKDERYETAFFVDSSEFVLYRGCTGTGLAVTMM